LAAKTFLLTQWKKYCRYLGAALQAHEFQMQIRRVPWEVHGWHPIAAPRCNCRSRKWRGTLGVGAIYGACLVRSRLSSEIPARPSHAEIRGRAASRSSSTTLSRSPVHASSTGYAIACNHAPCVAPWISRDAAIFSVPPERLSWLKTIPSNVSFIPVGANLPSLESPASGKFGRHSHRGSFQHHRRRTRSSGNATDTGRRQHASRKLGRIRLSVFGRHSELREEVLAPRSSEVSGLSCPSKVLSSPNK